jgi:hypothetical protein
MSAVRAASSASIELSKKSVDQLRGRRGHRARFERADTGCDRLPRAAPAVVCV